MKWSKYNYIFESEKFGNFLYNGFLNLLWKLEDGIYSEIKALKSNPEKYSEKDKLSQLLVKNRILVEDDNVDKDNFKLQYLMKTFEKTHLAFTILPTLDCNFRCPYCFENNVKPITMTKDVENKIIEYIKYNTIATKFLFITWYGGEPLLNFESICNITKEVKELKLSYSASMVTNGYLLNENIIEQLDDLNIVDIQITIDGTEDIHNLKRPHFENNDSFQKIMKNLDLLVNKKGKKISISLRVNIDNANSEEYIKIYRFLKDKYEGKVHIYPGIIKDWSGENKIDCGFDKKEEVQFIISQYEKYKIKPSRFYPSYATPCVAQRVYDYVIGPQGELYKCWSDVGQPEYVVGNLFSNESNSELITKYLVSIDAFHSSKCKDCFFLFVCGGGCPNQQLKNKFNGTSFDTCTYFKNNLDKFLEIHFETKDLAEIQELQF